MANTYRSNIFKLKIASDRDDNNFNDIYEQTDCYVEFFCDVAALLFCDANCFVMLAADDKNVSRVKVNVSD